MNDRLIHKKNSGIRLLFCLIGVLFIFAGYIFFVRAYGAEPTHPFLAEKSGELFNNFYNDKLNPEEIEWLREGAIDEDVSPRWINHFYDPLTGLGWQGKRLGEKSEEEIRFWSDKLIVDRPALAAPDWANNFQAQKDYANYGGDYTFDRAVDDYLKGDKKRAYFALGHILHLIEDMTVPAHVRQDTHADVPGFAENPDPYESWAVNSNNLKIDFNRIISQYQNFKCLNLQNCFDQIALYTNQNFFSKDTASYSDYPRPEFTLTKKMTISGKDYMIAYGQDEQGIFPLFLYSEENKWVLDYDFIHQAYWNRLSAKAIMGGAEIIRLFKEEVIRRANNPAEETESKVIQNTADRPSAKIFSWVGEADKLRKQIKKVKAAVQGWISKLVFPASSILSAIEQTRAPQITGSTIVKALENITPPKNSLAENSLTEKTLSEPQDKLAILETAPLGKENPALNIAEIIHDPWLAPLVINEPGSDNAPSEIEEQIFEPQAPIPIEIVALNLSSALPISPVSPPRDSGGATPSSPIASGSSPTEADADDEVGVDLPATTTAPDLIPPNFSIGFRDYQIFSPTFTVFWQSTSTDLAFYEVEWRDQSTSSWQSWGVNGSSTMDKLFESREDEIIYYFRGRATDAAGNQSVWQEISAEINSRPVVINEIAWMGTGASSQLTKDEWLELYNKSNSDLDLAGWSLTGSAGGPDIVFASSTIIKAKSYFLIERTDDDETVSDIVADWKGSFGNGLNDEGEILELKTNTGQSIDRVGDEGNNRWYAGNKDQRRSMERISPRLAGNLAGNWKNNNIVIRNGLAADGATLINGTPARQNSVFKADYIIPPYGYWQLEAVASFWPPYGVSFPSLIMDEENRPHLLWYQYNSGGANAVYNFYNGERWQSRPIQLNTGTLREKAAPVAPRLFKDSQGGLSAAFTAGDYNRYSVYFSQLRDEDWSAPLNISGTSTVAYEISGAVDGRDRLHLTWRTISPDFEIFYRVFDPSAEIDGSYENYATTSPDFLPFWSPILKVSSSSRLVYSPTLALDQNDQPYIFWPEFKDGEGGGVYFSALNGNQWSEPTKILDYQIQYGFYPDALAVALNVDGRFWLGWSDKPQENNYYLNVFLALFDPVANQTSLLSNISDDPIGFSRAPKMALDSEGNLYFFWMKSVPAGENQFREQIFYRRRDGAQGSLGEPVNPLEDLNANLFLNALLMGENDQFFAAWSNWGVGQVNIYYGTANP